MFKFILRLTTLIAAATQASQATPADIEYIRVASYECSTPIDLNIRYDAARDDYKLLAQWSSVDREFYVDNIKIDRTAKTTEIRFTGHRPSAGPAYEPWESDYVIRVNQLIKPGGQTSVISGNLYRSVSYGPFFWMSNIECTVISIR